MSLILVEQKQCDMGVYYHFTHCESREQFNWFPTKVYSNEDMFDVLESIGTLMEKTMGPEQGFIQPSIPDGNVLPMQCLSNQLSFGMIPTFHEPYLNCNDHAGSLTPFDEWADIWFSNHKGDISKTTQEGYRYTLAILKGYFGQTPIRKFTAFDIECFLKELRNEGRSASQLSKCRGMLYQIFDMAIGLDILEKNPVAHAKKIRRSRKNHPPKKKEAFSKEEIRKLMAELPYDRMGCSIRLMLATGMRTQEVMGLEPRHIAEDGSSIIIEQAVVTVKGHSEIGPPKSSESYRTIPVPELVRDCAIKLRNTSRKYIWEGGKKDMPCNPCNFRRQFSKALSQIQDVRVLTPHCCRHTYVTQMQALGIDIETIQTIVGHADVDMTAHYLHIQEPKRLAAAEKFSSEFSARYSDAV